VSAHVDDAVAHGARLLTGGHARPDVGPFCYEPTVLDGVPPAAACFADETFGPVVSVYRVASDAHAVAMANATEYGLNGTVWTRDLRRGRLLARQLRVGTAAVNEAFIATWGSVASPMGGRGESGLGRRHGKEGLLRFTESQTVAVQRGMGLAAMYAAGGQRMSVAFTTALRMARATRLPWP
jgi:succinate-semialdehyde dehydrogenase/glutarate-semialdehyde dehydrogenase